MTKEETATDVAKSLIPSGQFQFILRRAHSLCGLIPLALFVPFHLFANSYSLRGAPGFNPVVDTLRGMPYISAISLAALSIPFLFHIFYGLFIIFKGRIGPDLRQPHPRNWAYFLQRLTAVWVAVFVIDHVLYIKFNLLRHDGLDYYALMRQNFSNIGTVVWYTLSLAAVAFHIANGVCTLCMTWGITVSKHSQRFTALVMTVAGFGLFALGIGAMSGFILQPDVYEPAPKAHTTQTTP